MIYILQHDCREVNTAAFSTLEKAEAAKSKLVNAQVAYEEDLYIEEVKLDPSYIPYFGFELK